MSNLVSIIMVVVISLVALAAIGLILTRLYVRSSKDLAFVRTGSGGQKVVLDGGALVIGFLHNIMWVNMTTVKLTVKRDQRHALITKDRLRVDVEADFYVRVGSDASSVACAAQTLGEKTLKADDLKSLIEGKIVDALRGVAAQMEMEELHEHRTLFVQNVQKALMEDLAKNGLTLESVSLTGLDQTPRTSLDPSNAFDAQGLAKLTSITEAKRREVNDIEQSNRVDIEKRNLEATRETENLRREREMVTLKTTQEIESARSQQNSTLAIATAEREREANLAQIRAAQETKAAEIAQNEAIQAREVERERNLQIARQEAAIEVARRSSEQSEAEALAQKARAEAVSAQEQVETARQVEIADRARKTALVVADQNAQEKAIGIRVSAHAELEAAEARAKARVTEAEGEAQAAIHRAEGIRAEAEAVAMGEQKKNEAANALSPDARQMVLRQELYKVLPSIIRESAAPMQKIDSIRLVQVGGLQGLTHGGAEGDVSIPASSRGLGDELVRAGLHQRAFGPLVDGVLEAGGLGKGGDFATLLAPVMETIQAAPTVDEGE